MTLRIKKSILLTRNKGSHLIFLKHVSSVSMSSKKSDNPISMPAKSVNPISMQAKLDNPISMPSKLN